MTDFKIKKDVEMYVKMGLTNEYAVLVACSQNGVPEKAEQYIIELKEEQEELAKSIKEMLPFEENVKQVYTDDKAEDANTECK